MLMLMSRLSQYKCFKCFLIFRTNHKTITKIFYSTEMQNFRHIVHMFPPFLYFLAFFCTSCEIFFYSLAHFLVLLSLLGAFLSLFRIFFCTFRQYKNSHLTFTSHVPHVRWNISCVTCHLSSVTCHLPPVTKTTATATEPPPAKSPIMHII